MIYYILALLTKNKDIIRYLVRDYRNKIKYFEQKITNFERNDEEFWNMHLHSKMLAESHLLREELLHGWVGANSEISTLRRKKTVLSDRIGKLERYLMKE